MDTSCWGEGVVRDWRGDYGWVLEGGWWRGVNEREGGGGVNERKIGGAGSLRIGGGRGCRWMRGDERGGGGSWLLYAIHLYRIETKRTNRRDEGGSGGEASRGEKMDGWMDDTYTRRV